MKTLLADKTQTHVGRSLMGICHKYVNYLILQSTSPLSLIGDGRRVHVKLNWISEHSLSFNKRAVVGDIWQTELLFTWFNGMNVIKYNETGDRAMTFKYYYRWDNKSSHYISEDIYKKLILDKYYKIVIIMLQFLWGHWLSDGEDFLFDLPHDFTTIIQST